jgi:electron transfer flavoprotein alpha subunit
MHSNGDAGAREGVLVFGEIDGDHLSPLTLELLGTGATLAGDIHQTLHLVHVGAEIPAALVDAYGYGAMGVYAASDPALAEYEPDLYLQAMEQVVGRLRPRIILFGQTDKGLDLAPRLAFRLRAGVTLDCIDLAVAADTGTLRAVKPVFGGKAHAVFAGSASPQIASVRQGSFPAAPYTGSTSNTVIPVDLALDTSRARTRVVRKVRDEAQALALNLASAQVVVSGGRGLRNADGVDLISATADLLGGAIAGTRAAVESGWLPRSVLVGLTGRRVNPRLYMAVGISGSLHHMAGCMRSQTIVAVNVDESAPIFMFSHIGVVGDYREVLKAFNDEVGAIKNQL